MEVSKHTPYIAPKSTHESWCITALEPVRGVLQNTHKQNIIPMCSSHNLSLVSSFVTLAALKGIGNSAAGKVTAGLAENNGSLPPGGWHSHLQADCPSPKLNNKYQKPLPFLVWFMCLI